MADEQQTQNDATMQEGESQQTSEEQPFTEDFDWAAYFRDEDEPAEQPPAQTQQAPPAADSSGLTMEQMQAQLREAQEASTKALALAQQAQMQGQLKSAFDVWREKATPPEIAMESLILNAKTPEEFQQRVSMVKEAATAVSGDLEAVKAKAIRDAEMEVQRAYGLPVPPNFQQIPQEEKAKQLLRDGDLDGAAAMMIDGLL